MFLDELVAVENDNDGPATQWFLHRWASWSAADTCSRTGPPEGDFVLQSSYSNARRSENHNSADLGKIMLSIREFGRFHLFLLIHSFLFNRLKDNSFLGRTTPIHYRDHQDGQDDNDGDKSS